MKDHILAAMSEQLDRWEALLASMGDEQIAAPDGPRLPVKDVIAHLWAWQQRSRARMEAALLDREPVFPAWAEGIDPEVEDSTDRTNAWIYEAYREQPWAQTHELWSAGYRRLLELGATIEERDLLDGARYPWMDGHPLAFVLVASYEHHQEHLDEVLARQRGGAPGAG